MKSWKHSVFPIIYVLLNESVRKCASQGTSALSNSFATSISNGVNLGIQGFKGNHNKFTNSPFGNKFGKVHIDTETASNAEAIAKSDLAPKIKNSDNPLVKVNSNADIRDTLAVSNSFAASISTGLNLGIQEVRGDFSNFINNPKFNTFGDIYVASRVTAKSRALANSKLIMQIKHNDDPWVRAEANSNTNSQGGIASAQSNSISSIRIGSMGRAKATSIANANAMSKDFRDARVSANATATAEG